MTFLKEEEVFPTVTDSDASKILEDSSKLSVPTILKEEAHEANNANVVADGKRKLSDDQAEKKVPSLYSFYIFI